MASLPYPRCPPNSFHRTHSKFVCVSPPTEFTEFTEISGGGYSPTDFTEYTEASGGEEPPTDFTDAHRWLGCVGFCGKIVWWLRGYGRMPYPPTKTPTDCTDVHRLGGKTQPKNLCESVQSVGGSYLPEVSVYSVQSVGEYPLPEISVNSVNSVGGPCANKLGVGSVGGIRRAAWVWQGCHTLLRKLPRIARMCTD